MSARLMFEVPRLDGTGAVVLHDGHNRFRLYAGSGGYVLPDVVLVPDPGVPVVVVQSLDVVDVRPPSAFDRRLRNWGTRPAGPVSGREVISSGRTINLYDVEPSGATVKVLWELHLGGLPESFPVELNFRPADEEPGPEEESAVGLGWDPIRARGAERQREGWVATVDFGTTGSTVTLRQRGDDRNAPHREWLATMAEGLADLIASVDGPTTEEPGTTDGELAELVRDTLRGIDESDLPATLRGNPADDLVLDLCKRLDRAAEGGGPGADRLLDALLHHYRRADRTPPFTRAQLAPHRIDRDSSDPYTVDSAVKVESLAGRPGWLYLGPRSGDAAPPATTATIRDLKRRFARSRDLGVDPRALLPELAHLGDGGQPAVEQVVAGVYDFLLDHAERFGPGGSPDTPSRLPKIVLTFPTTTTPIVRQSLKELVEHGLGVRTVVTDIDEALAAGMYFLMTDVGAVPEVGLEHFRARSRELPVEPGQRPQWEQTAVVVDIGGGTTDIAVLRHILVDETPDRPDLPPDQVGRFYALYPEVVGVSGHRMLGGHYLTLRVFYWLKAAILDELLKRGLLQPLGKGKLTGGLAARVVSGAPPREVVPKEVGDILREALPTTWDEQHVPADEDGFDAFWRKAEELKLALSAGEPQDLDTREVQELIESINPKHRGRENVFGELWTDGPLVDLKNLGVELALVDFERLVHPGLKTAASLAADLVGKVLENRRATGLDRILLTGQTSQMDLVARTIRAELQGLSHAGRVIPTPEPEVERARPKLAASLGAAYFERVIEFARGRDDPAVLEHGRTEVDVRAGDLHRALPNDFVVEGHLGEETLFRLGEPFREVDSAGRRAVRSGFRPFTAYTHSLYRAYGTEQIPWSSFSITGHAGHDGRPKFDPGVWGREGSMHVMVELDDSCTPALYFCNGDTPRVVAPTGGVPFRPRSAGLFDAENYLTALPEISVRTGGYGDPVTRVLVEAGPAESIGLPTLQVHRSDAPTSPHVLGWVLPDLPPLSRETGEYEFVVDHGGSTQRLPPIRPEGGRGARYRYRALLTADAVLHVFRGELRFVEAATFTLCEEFPGSVWTPRLTATPRPSESDWNPFSGRH